jgi:hypothetical protein
MFANLRPSNWWWRYQQRRLEIKLSTLLDSEGEGSPKTRALVEELSSVDFAIQYGRKAPLAFRRFVMYAHRNGIETNHLRSLISTNALCFQERPFLRSINIWIWFLSTGVPLCILGVWSTFQAFAAIPSPLSNTSAFLVCSGLALALYSFFWITWSELFVKAPLAIHSSGKALGELAKKWCSLHTSIFAKSRTSDSAKQLI